MLSEPVTNLEFIIPNGLEPINEQILRCLDPCATHDKIATVKIRNVEVFSARKASIVILQPCAEACSLLLWGECMQGIGVSFSDVNRVILSRDWLVAIECASVVDRVNARAIKRLLNRIFQQFSVLKQQRPSNDVANYLWACWIEYVFGLSNLIE